MRFGTWRIGRALDDGREFKGVAANKPAMAAMHNCGLNMGRHFAQVQANDPCKNFVCEQQQQIAACDESLVHAQSIAALHAFISVFVFPATQARSRTAIWKDIAAQGRADVKPRDIWVRNQQIYLCIDWVGSGHSPQAEVRLKPLQDELFRPTPLVSALGCGLLG